MNAIIISSVAKIKRLLHGEEAQIRRIYTPRPSVVFGDIRWVREAFALVPASAYRCSDVVQIVNPDDRDEAVVFRAGWTLSRPGQWKSGSLMPHWAARLVIRVTDVRMECVQAIRDADFAMEGVGDRSDFALRWDRRY